MTGTDSRRPLGNSPPKDDGLAGLAGLGVTLARHP